MRVILSVAVFAILPNVAKAQNDVAQPFLGWMAWTWQTGVFFGAIASVLVCMTLWEIWRPGGNPRPPGIFGIDTTRGDRLFISLLSGAYIHLGWLALASGPLWYASIIALIWAAIVFRWV